MTASIALHEGFVPPAEPVAESAAMREALAAAADVAETPTTVLLLGESEAAARPEAASAAGQDLPGRIGRSADNCPPPVGTWRARTSQGDRV